MTPLVIWSGGVESTSMLKSLLEKARPTGKVVAHHIVLKTAEQRHVAELVAIKKLTPRLREIHDFEYSESMIELVGGQGMTVDYVLWFTVALAAMRYHGCNCIVRGRCAEDNWLRSEDRNADYQYLGKHRWDRHFELLGPMLMLDESVHRVAPYLKDYSKPKAWHWQRLGELAEMTHSCQRPIDLMTPCGTCHSCVERDAAKLGSSAVDAIAADIAQGTSF